MLQIGAWNPQASAILSVTVSQAAGGTWCLLIFTFIKGAIFKCETPLISEFVQTHFLPTKQATWPLARIQSLAQITAPPVLWMTLPGWPGRKAGVYDKGIS